MLRRLTDQISKSIDYLKACFKSENLFEANNQREISD